MKKLIFPLAIFTFTVIVSLFTIYVLAPKTEIAGGAATCTGTESYTYTDYGCEKVIKPGILPFWKCVADTRTDSGTCSTTVPPGGAAEACGFFERSDETCTASESGCIYGSLTPTFHFCSTDGDGDGEPPPPPPPPPGGVCDPYPGGVGQACKPSTGCYCKGTDDTSCVNTNGNVVTGSGTGTCQRNVTVNVWADKSSVPACENNTIHWDSSYTSGGFGACQAVYGTGSDFWPSGSVSVDGSRTGQEDNQPNPPPFSRTYGVQCSNSFSTRTGSASVNITAGGLCPNPPTVNLTPNPNPIPCGSSSTTLSWTTTNNPTSCTASGDWSGSKSTSGGSETKSNITSTKTYTITCSNSVGSDTDTETVTVASCPPTCSINCNPSSVTTGNSALVSWSSTNATSCTISPPGWTGTSGSQNTGPLTSSKTYTETCSGPGGTVSCSTTCNVTGCTVDLDANGSDGPITINSGSSANLSWTSTSATSCTASGSWSGPKTVPSGSESTGDLTQSQGYTLTCSGAGNSSCTDSVNVTVTGPITPTADISANPTTVDYDTASIISWTSARLGPGESNTGGSCTVTNTGNDTVWTDTSGSYSSGNLTSDRTYNLNCTGPNGSPSDSVTVTVGQPPHHLTANLVANPGSGNAPLNSTLIASAGGTATGTINYTFWKDCNNSARDVNGALGACGQWDGKYDGMNPSSQPHDVTYPSQGTYHAKVIIERESFSEEARVTVNVSESEDDGDGDNGDGDGGDGDGGLPPPTVDIDAYPTVIYQGGLSTLTWSSADAVSCSASASPASGEWTGSKPTSGQQVVTPGGTTTYTLTCFNEEGDSGFDTVTVVAPSIREILPTL